MGNYVSSTVFEVVGEKLEYRGWDVRGDHIYRQTSYGVEFGDTGIFLSLAKGVPKLQVPKGQNAELLQSDCAFYGDRRVDGKFVQVLIY